MGGKHLICLLPHDVHRAQLAIFPSPLPINQLPGALGTSAIHSFTWQAKVLVGPIPAVIKEVAAQLSPDAFPVFAVEFILLVAAVPGPASGRLCVVVETTVKNKGSRL